MRIYYYTLLFFLLFTSNLTAQKGTLTATVVNTDKEPLIGASILLLYPSQKVCKATIADDNGYFKLKKIPEGDFLLKITYVGFKDFEQQVSLAQKKIDLGQLVLSEGLDLDEVEVVGKLEPFVMKGDTVEYNAAAFSTLPNADAIELIRKLPGITIQDGTIIAHGEEAVEILVDGEPFFGMAAIELLETLPADILNKIQVYEYNSEEARFLGIDEFNMTKTINLTLYEDKKTGVFGDVNLGYGSPDKYKFGGNTNLLNKKQRVSIRGNTDNINNNGQGFSGISRGGINTKYNVKANFSDKWGEKTSFNVSYGTNGSNRATAQDERTLYANEEGSQEVYAKQNFNQQKTTSHKLDFKLKYQIDSSSFINFMPKFNLSASANTSTSDSQTTSALNYLINQNTKISTSENDRINPSAFLNYIRKFKKPKRSLSLITNYTLKDNNQNRVLLSDNLYTQDGLLVNDSLHQQTTQLNQNWSFNTILSYKTPLGKNGMIHLDYRFKNNDNTTDKETLAFDEATASYVHPVDLLTNELISQDINQNVSATYSIDKQDKYAIQLIAKLQNIQQSNTQLHPEYEAFEQKYWNFIPAVNLRKYLPNNQNIQLRATYRVRPPNIYQLQNVLNNDDPLRMSIGNPALKQAITYFLDASYDKSNPTNYSFLSVNVNSSISQNQFTTSRFLVETDNPIFERIQLIPGAQLSMPINTNRYWYTRVAMNYSHPIYDKQISISSGLSFDYNQRPSYLNDQLILNKNRITAFNFSFQKSKVKNIDFNISSNTDLNIATNSAVPDNNSQYIRQNTSLYINWASPKRWQIDTDLTHQWNISLNDDFNENFLLWNINIHRVLFKNKKGRLSLSVFDVLKQNRIISRQVSSTFIKDTTTNALQRFFLVSFSYRFRKFGLWQSSNEAS